jgi:hypothetical protein
LDAGEHWSEQAKPKGAARDGGAFTREAMDASCVKLRSERSAQRSPFRAGIPGKRFFGYFLVATRK